MGKNTHPRSPGSAPTGDIAAGHRQVGVSRGVVAAWAIAVVVAIVIVSVFGPTLAALGTCLVLYVAVITASLDVTGRGSFAAQGWKAVVTARRIRGGRRG